MRRRALGDDERADWLRLSRTESVGSATFAYLIDRFGTARAALSALPDLARRGGRATAPRVPSQDTIQREIDAGRALGARLTASIEPGFPYLLAMANPAPPLIWTLGDPSLLSRNTIAIVGARAASAAGLRFARQLATDLGQAGWVVVSGMARGIDAAAHEGSLASGSAAVLAGGVDDIYPPQHKELHEQLGARGCIVSEREIGATARAADFPRRNRIISGLSRGVVVVEAELRSGSLITARLAADQGREVFAVPGSPLDPRSRGANSLLKQGATLVEDASDILATLLSLPGLSEGDEAPQADAFPSPLPDDPPDAAFQSALLDLLSLTPISVNDLVRELREPVGRVTASLVELSLAERVECGPGGWVAKR